jgi:hypothetical protein
LGVRSASDIEPAFSRLREQRGEAVLLMPDGLFFAERNLIARLQWKAPNLAASPFHLSKLDVCLSGMSLNVAPRPTHPTFTSLDTWPDLSSHLREILCRLHTDAFGAWE